MPAYVEQGFYAPTAEKQVFASHDCVSYTLTSAADGTLLTGTGDVLVITSDANGYFYVSQSATDKAAVGKIHRIASGIRREIGIPANVTHISWIEG